MRLPILLLAIAQLSSAAIISSANCSISAFNTPTQSSTGTTSCSVTGGGQPPSQANASVNLVGDFGIHVVLLARTSTDIVDGQLKTFLAVSSLNVARTEMITTTGPIRSGLVALLLQPMISLGSDTLPTSGTDARFDQYSASYSRAGGLTCSPGGIPPFCFQGVLMPITLGQSIEVRTAAALVAADPLGIAEGTVNLSFQLFESDGVTPVEWALVQDVPEPATLLLTAAALGALVVRRAKRPSRM